MAGFVYIMSNPSFADGRIKIGKSDRDPEEFRKAELNSTGVPEPFKVEYSAYVQNHHKLEHTIHKYFVAQRPNKSREFFTCSIMDAISAIQKNAGDGLKHEDNYYAEYEELIRQKQELERIEELRIQAEEEEQIRREKAERIRRKAEERQKEVDQARREEEERLEQVRFQEIEAERILQLEIIHAQREEEERIKIVEEDRRAKLLLEKESYERLQKFENLKSRLVDEYRTLEKAAGNLVENKKKKRRDRKKINKETDKKVEKFKRKFDNEFSDPISSENDFTSRVAFFRREMTTEIVRRHQLSEQHKLGLEEKLLSLTNSYRLEEGELTSVIRTVVQKEKENTLHGPNELPPKTSIQEHQVEQNPHCSSENIEDETFQMAEQLEKQFQEAKSRLMQKRINPIYWDVAWERMTAEMPQFISDEFNNIVEKWSDERLKPSFKPNLRRVSDDLMLYVKAYRPKKVDLPNFDEYVEDKLNGEFQKPVETKDDFEQRIFFVKKVISEYAQEPYVQSFKDLKFEVRKILTTNLKNAGNQIDGLISSRRNHRTSR
jgi:hypothetical protein